MRFWFIALMLFGCNALGQAGVPSIDKYIDLDECVPGLVMSPGYNPTNPTLTYPANQHIVTLVTAKPGQQINVQVNSFTLQFPSGGNCVDYVEFYDGDITSGTADLVIKSCGYDMPPMFTTSGSALTVIFHSDSSTQKRGFKAVLTPDCAGCNFAPDMCTITDVGNCVDPMDQPCGDLILGLSQVYYNVTCGPKNLQCGVPCDDCDDDTDQELSCDDALAGHSDCYLNRHTPCSVTIGVGTMVAEYICVDDTGRHYFECIEPCCCNPHGGTGPPPPLNCYSPEVFLITEGKEIYCDELPRSV